MPTSRLADRALVLRAEKRILLLRGHKVLLDQDLAALYGVPTQRLNEQVRRNLDRFPEDFMFELTDAEFAALRSQSATSKGGRGGRRYRPLAFTEQGVAMLSSVLRSRRAVQVNIAIMRAHLAMDADRTNTLYRAADRLSFTDVRGAGTFQWTAPDLVLSATDGRSPSEWALPIGFHPGDRVPMSYHADASRWSLGGNRVGLRSATRGQEFVIDLDAYPELLPWLEETLLAHR